MPAGCASAAPLLAADSAATWAAIGEKGRRVIAFVLGPAEPSGRAGDCPRAASFGSSPAPRPQAALLSTRREPKRAPIRHRQVPREGVGGVAKSWRRRG